MKSILIENFFKMVEYQSDVKTILGEKMYGKLKQAAKESKITVKKAQQLAFLLHPSVGGSFKNSRGRQDFEYDGDTFMQVLGEYVGKSEKAEQESLPDKILDLLRHEDIGLNKVASELEEVKPQKASMEVKQKLGKMSQRKRKGDDLTLKQNLPKRKRQEITSTHFFFVENVPGTEPKPSDQKKWPICTYHAMAKCIQQGLHDHGIDADHDEVVDSLLELFGDDCESRRHPKELDSKTIRVIERCDKTGQQTGRCFLVTLRVNNAPTGNKPWPKLMPDTDRELRTSSKDILAVGLLLLSQNDPKSAHAVYIKSYNTRTHEVQTINSHGNEGELGPRRDGVLKEEDFYAICFVRLSAFQVTYLVY